ncbi:hypothetical protein T492DRAFT_1136182 [Pavlovales sp. CCMP2436]|nr:hypothetical protein T492DRAFT_1136182 [Pavlovales sp. CCMP2436]
MMSKLRRRSHVRAGAVVHPGDDFSYAKTNSRSPVACSQLAAPSPSPPAYSPYVPSGAAGETVWQRTRVHTPGGESLHMPHPGVLCDASSLREALCTSRQQDGLRQTRASESSEEDIVLFSASNPAKSVVRNRPARTAESTADWSACASHPYLRPHMPGRLHLEPTATRQDWDSRTRSRRRDQHTPVSRMTRIHTGLGEPSAPGAGLSCRSRPTSDWAPPETTPSDMTLLDKVRHLPPGSSRQSRRYSDRALPDSMLTPDGTSLEEYSGHSSSAPRSSCQPRHPLEAGSSPLSLGPRSNRRSQRYLDLVPPEITLTTPNSASLEVGSSPSLLGPRSSRRSRRYLDLVPPEITLTTPNSASLEAGSSPSSLSSRSSRRSQRYLDLVPPEITLTTRPTRPRWRQAAAHRCSVQGAVVDPGAT